MSEIKVIAGLGNPGTGYEKTRHNLGFRTVDALAQRWDAGWKNWSGSAVIASAGGGKPLLIKPQMYMNNSGAALAEYLRYRQISPEELLVVVDDFSLPLHTIRLRLSGSAGGHNGLASIIEHLGTCAFPRLRLGIGPVPAGADPADFVLSAFPAAERESVESMLADACVFIENALTEGLEKALSKMPSKSDKK